MAETKSIIRPQAGYQVRVLSNPADIVVGGGAAGVGKTFSLLLEPLRHITTVPSFGGVIFRRTTPQIRNQGGLWDASTNLYKLLGASEKETALEWYFQHGNRLKFSHLEYDKNVYDWQGSEIPFIGFDELTHFSEKMFFYLLTRNRSTCGVKPYVRCTCNPDPESWVCELISHWIDQTTGYPIPERNGKLRYFLKHSDAYVWGDSKEEVYEKAKTILDEMGTASNHNPFDFIKSISFVSGSIYDNKKLLDIDPSYLANLMALDEQEKAKLLGGCWKRFNDEKQMFKWDPFQGMFHNSIDCSQGLNYIIADIAMEGSNKLAIGYFKGNSIEDLKIMARNDGKQALVAMEQMARTYSVPNTRVLFDADGVGAYLGGFIRGAVPFHGGGKVLETQDPVSKRQIKENFFNLKAQCYYHAADKVNGDKMHISEYVGNMMYDEKMTVKQRFNYERKAIKKATNNADGKRKIISKDEQKMLLGGDSPDLMDMLMMRSYFDFQTLGKITHYK